MNPIAVPRLAADALVDDTVSGLWAIPHQPLSVSLSASMPATEAMFAARLQVVEAANTVAQKGSGQKRTQFVARLARTAASFLEETSREQLQPDAWLAPTG